MLIILTTFQCVSIIFACAATFTGIQAMLDPVGFAASFGIPVLSFESQDRYSKSVNTVTTAYISLMGVRQLATGITLLVFASQRQWYEMATLLSILGFVVAGTDGYFLYKMSSIGKGAFHAVPGAAIALLAMVTLLYRPRSSDIVQ
ncbi:hypothetical protein BT63DRAFT_313259 [Microthyrium microscopicum]|uniref:DUF4267 domain-containing protein n=1 Tax=Microthyrium microscopicum TaxID=703497 RepID=A0A6A6U5R0_9PEZI|nr:hypothetical protein BT63DRAFT_313259 [Microthyrium microscopicum]